jgi:hypothetical protein
MGSLEIWLTACRPLFEKQKCRYQCILLTIRPRNSTTRFNAGATFNTFSSFNGSSAIFLLPLLQTKSSYDFNGKLAMPLLFLSIPLALMTMRSSDFSIRFVTLLQVLWTKSSYEFNKAGAMGL